MLKWAREAGCEWDAGCLTWASGGGDLDVVKWCKENGCEWNTTMCAAAAREGHLEVLQWARSKVRGGISLFLDLFLERQGGGVYS